MTALIFAWRSILCSLEGLDISPEARFPNEQIDRRVKAIKLLFKFEFVRIRNRRLSLHSKGSDFLDRCADHVRDCDVWRLTASSQPIIGHPATGHCVKT